jgi:ribonuclease T1
VSSTRSRAALAGVVAALAGAAIVIPGLGGDGEEPAAPASVPASEIGRTLAAIESGAPLPYEQDGATFENREGLLPDQLLGYYREYIVETPGSPDRGARRLVIGEGGEVYYTDDHYASFQEIDPEAFR